jgi:3-oxoacyl-[acyl-carrier-protein] synthase III
MKSYIKAISYYLPEKRLDNETIAKEFPEWSIEKIAQKTGIHTRHIADKNELSSDLGIASAKKLFQEYNIDPKEIDFVLFCTQSPDYFLPTTACYIQNELGIPKSSGAFDFNLGCSGFIYGLSIAKGLIETEQASNVLLITAETYSKFIHPKDKSVKTIFGDAAASTLVSAVEGAENKIGPFIFGTDGQGGKNLIVKAGGLRFPKTDESGTDFTDEYGNVRNDNSLFMNGSEIFNFSLREVPPVIEKLYTKANLTEKDISLFIFHQANKYMLDFLRKKIKISEDKFYEYLAEVGNTVSSSIPIALKNAIIEGKVAKNDNLILVGFGVGYSWGGCIINF